MGGWLGTFAAFALMAGCARQVPATFVPATPRVPVKLAATRFERASLTFDGLADVTPDVTRWDVGGVFIQRRPLGSSDESLRIIVRAHPDETLDTFEQHPSWFVLSPRASTTVCGLPAEMVRGAQTARHISCVEVVDGPSHPASLPPASIVVGAFSRPPLRTLFSIEVSASRPEVYGADVDRILASIRCQ